MNIPIPQLIYALARWEVYEQYKDFEKIFGYKRAPEMYHKFMTKGRNLLPFYTSLHPKDSEKLTEFIIKKYL